MNTKTNDGNGKEQRVLALARAESQISEVMSIIGDEANRLTALVEARKITVSEYKRRMWEQLGISPHCLKEGVSYIIQPELDSGSSARHGGEVEA